MNIKRDQVVGLALIAIGIVFAILISQFETPFTPEYPGPKAMPGLGVFGLIVCGAGVFVNGCRQKDGDKIFVDVAGWMRILVTFAILCVYVFLMKYLGFIVVTPPILFGLTTYFSKASNMETKLVNRIIFAVAVTAIIYVMYVPLFGMTLPSGLLFE